MSFRPLKIVSVGTGMVLVALFLSSSAHANSDGREARRFILDGVATAVALLKAHDLTRAEIVSRLRREFRDRFDVAGLMSLTLGTAHRKATPDQLRRFHRELEDLIVQTYANRVLVIGPKIKSDIGDIIRVVRTSGNGNDDLVVQSEINRPGANWVKIDWRLHRRDGGFRIVDVVVLGISQAQLYKAEFASVMRRSGRGIDGLIEALHRKNRMLRVP